jgi:allophanate hydrolase subunit 2
LVNNKITTLQQWLRLHTGESISFEPPSLGARLWVAFGGGLVQPENEIIQRGEVIELAIRGKQAAVDIKLPEPANVALISAIPERPEFGQLFENEYVVRHDSNRVGIRLDGPKMKHKLEFPSEPATLGVVQVTPEGLPIILGPDGPTIGGYPRAAVVASAERCKLAQLRPGDKVNFVPISVDAARKLIH